MRLIGLVCPCAVSIALLATATCNRGAQPTPGREGSTGSAASTTSPGSEEAGQVDAAGAPCPDDMVFVDTTFCSDVERRCTDMEKEHRNHLNICHAFATEQTCRDPARADCILHRPLRVPEPERRAPRSHARLVPSAGHLRIRPEASLCWASEWTAACEGPKHTPFPYGWARDHDACNMDNFYIDPKRPSPKSQFFFYSKDRQVALAELSRLDQSVPCGSMESCKSGFGVYDMTGNVDEWVSSDESSREKSKWAGLKGGAWGHVRSQCRPMTTSHEPEFTYYFVGFRCCRDALEPGAPKWLPSPRAATPPVVEPHDFARERRSDLAAAPGPSKAKFSRTGKPE